MFGNLSWEHILVLVVVALVVLGPERLPGAIRWTSNALRQARDYLSGVTNQLREDMGPEFDEVIHRLESGQSPDQIEKDMPDLGADDGGGMMGGGGGGDDFDM